MTKKEGQKTRLSLFWRLPQRLSVLLIRIYRGPTSGFSYFRKQPGLLSCSEVVLISLCTMARADPAKPKLKLLSDPAPKFNESDLRVGPQ